jgi:hypothetical protein
MDNKEKKQLIKVFSSFLEILESSLKHIKLPAKELSHLAENIKVIINQLETEINGGK